MKFTTVQKAIIALVVANVIWGAASPIFKIALQNIPPFTLAFWRFFLGSLILAAYLKFDINFSLKSKKEILLFTAYALTGITANIIFYFWGLELTYAINAPVIAAGGPIITLLFALLLLHEPFIAKKFLGMVLGTLGILVIVIEPLLHTGIDGSALGNFLFVLATVAAVASTIIGKATLPKYDPVKYTFGAFVVGWASFFPLAAFEYAKNPGLYQALDVRGYAGIAFGAILSSAVAYAASAWALSKISATDAAVFTYVDPVIGVVLAYFLLHEPITGPFLLGSLLIFAGIFLAEGRIHYHHLHLLHPSPTSEQPGKKEL